MNPISFGSVFKAYVTTSDVKRGVYSHPQLTNYLDKNNIQYSESFVNPKTSVHSLSLGGENYAQYIPSIYNYAVANYTIVAPDEKDSDIETICANCAIQYEKTSFDSLTNPMSVFRRIKQPPKGYVLAYVDSKELEKLIKTQNSNFDHCEKDYNQYFKRKTDFIIKNGDEITPQTLYISYLGDDSTPESLRRYVNRFGRRNLNHNSIGIYQSQEGKEDYINIYYGLKDLGYKAIPVYMDKNSYKNAQTLGLLRRNY